MGIFTKASIAEVMDGANKSGLAKNLTAMDLFLMGLGAVVGTGIFVITGAAAQDAGPAITLAFILSGICCIFVALAYTEIAAMIPTSGSVYAYAYVSLGEMAAFVVGWLLVLEFALGATTVASGWSGYVLQILNSGGVHLPEYLTKTPAEGGVVNLLAVLISVFITFILVRGTKESVKLNAILVVVKIMAIFLFIIIAAPSFNPGVHWENFMPNSFEGVFKAAAIVLFAYSGFDSVATASEECKNPSRDISIGLIGSLVACTILYVTVSGIVTGVVPYTELNNSRPLAHALSAIGSEKSSVVLAIGAITGMTTVMLVQIYGQSRILYVISRDGLLPAAFSKIHPKFQTPYISTILVGAFVAALSGLFPIALLAKLTSFGTLFAFIITCFILMILRTKNPEIKRPFKCPAAFIVAPIAILMCGFLMLKLIPDVWCYALIWAGIGVLIYFLYGIKHSKLKDKKDA